MSLPTFFVGPWELSEATAILPEAPSAGRILLVESTGKGSALPYHRWKLVLVLSALRHFRDELRARGYEVDHRVAPSYAEGIRAHALEYGVREVQVQEPAEWGIAQSMRPLVTDGLVRVLPDRRFLTPRSDFASWASGRKLLRMEDFYRWQRRRLGILVDGNGAPVGGSWNLDAENRKPARALLRHGLPSRPPPFAPDGLTARVMALVDGMPAHWGSTAGFDLPVTRAQALGALEDFLAHRFADFGPYEDAMLSGETYLYHSRLSAAMNVGLLSAAEIVQRAVSVAMEVVGRDRTVPLASLEGFVRQVIGWREYVNGIYWTRMPGYRDVNYFGFSRPLPRAYWEPEALDLACVSDSVRMVRDTAYAHHIHRLMVLCNFATLTGVHPLRLSEWFWAGFADAMEWVELPNVVGMGTFGDGGLMASKPYVSAAAYINRMSNYCGTCRYDPSLRTGADACPFNYLYWTFLDDVRRRGLDVGRRMALVLGQLDRLPLPELAAMHAERSRFLDTLEPEGSGWISGMTRADMTRDELRLHLPADTTPRVGGEFVLYWMQVTHRAHDNFALNFAVEQANALRLPLQVYHGLRRDYPWASDRFHTWILESVVDLHDAFEARGINYAFWLDRAQGGGAVWPAGNGERRRESEERESRQAPSALVQLADRSALVVTDYSPTFIVPRQVRSLRQKTRTPVIAIDSATLVPLKHLTKEHLTARGIRPVLLDALPHYLWPVDNPEPRVRRAVTLPFEAVRPTADTIQALVAECDIDHAVRPSAVFRGGTRAGRQRLQDFLRTGLARYEEERNDPNKPESVSRLSPWLHFGNLSIHEILLAAREAGPAHQYDKFQDEALVWREVSHNFCFFNPRHRTADAIPPWAREQLRVHEGDPRPQLYSDDELESAQTGSELWNAAQRSYVRDGWMNNYMRMLWGKAVLQWTPNATECLRILEHLNNKYSLDGRDPNSYGGIMWTFGKFDRPFYPRPIYGTVRYQSLRAAERKFDVPRYVGSFPPTGPSPRS